MKASLNTNSTKSLVKRRGILKTEKINKAIRSAKASLAVEDLHVTIEEENLIQSRLKGEISESEFRKRALQLINE